MGVAGQIRPWWSKIGMRESADDADGGGQSNWKPGCDCPTSCRLTETKVSASGTDSAIKWTQ